MHSHIWKQRWLKEPDPDLSRHVMHCARCGTWTEMTLPGVPNLNGAHIVERDCDVVIVRKIMTC